MTDGATLRIATPRATPITPPTTPRTRLSVNSCRTTRERPAPSAALVASSRRRTVARARRRLAMFAQQIRSTRPTTPRNRIDVSRSSRPTTAPCSGSIVTPRPVFDAGSSRASAAAIALRSPAAASCVTPGFSRPIASAYAKRPAFDGAAGGNRSVESAHMLDRPITCAASGTMPTTVHGSPSNRRLRPTMPGSALNLDRQKLSVSTTTDARSASSDGRNVRPTTGRTPRTSKMPELTHCRGTVSALPSSPASTMPATFGT